MAGGSDSEDGLGAESSVSSPPRSGDWGTASICKGVFLKGAKAGEDCTFKAKDNGYCGYHKRQAVEEAEEEDEEEEEDLTDAGFSTPPRPSPAGGASISSSTKDASDGTLFLYTIENRFTLAKE